MLLASDSKEPAIAVYLCDEDRLNRHLEQMGTAARNWAKAQNFTAKEGSHCLLPSESGDVSAVLVGYNQASPFSLGKAARNLPANTYFLASDIEDKQEAQLAVLGWCLGGYSFDRYRQIQDDHAKLICPETVDFDAVGRAASATAFVRDLINTPANDLMPDDLQAAIHQLADMFGAKVNTIIGDDLLKQNFPMVHAVGRASAVAPRLVDLKWGREDAPKVTLVGKGVCFDNGGLNIKPGNSMALMKKDMGGAANVLGLAMMIMSAQLDVRLRVLVPAVENAIAGNAFRPGDVLKSRDGMTVEIGNTDAEGRLILADALALADEEEPELLIDMATLTGAARVALGPDLPPFYSHDQKLADEVAAASQHTHDPLWQMPLWPAYDKLLSSKVADVNHISSGPFAGSITAALFLARFVKKSKSWVHFDVFGWVPNEKPHARVGGEAQGIRALFDVISTRFGN